MAKRPHAPKHDSKKELFVHDAEWNIKNFHLTNYDC